MPHLRLAVLLVAAALAPIGLAAAATSLTPKEYAQRGDAICADYKGKIKALGVPKTFADIVRYADRALPMARHAIAAASSFGPRGARQLSGVCQYAHARVDAKRSQPYAECASPMVW